MSKNIIPMKKKTVILIFVLLGFLASAQTDNGAKRQFPWNKITVGTEFCHTIERSYAYPDGMFRNHPNNSLNLCLSYDLGRKWTLGIFGGYYGCRRSQEINDFSMYQPADGLTTLIIMENRATFSFGIDATLHLLAFLYDAPSPYDLFLTGRIGKNPRDLDCGLGLGLSFSPLPQFYLYGKVYYGAFGYPNGMQESYNRSINYHAHLAVGASYRL